MNENTVNNSRNTFGFVGLGLIGGSIARAIRKYIPGARILAYTPHPETVQEAVSDGVVDEYVPLVGEGFSVCDVIFLCAPVEHNASNLQLLSSRAESEGGYNNNGYSQSNGSMGTAYAGSTDMGPGGNYDIDPDGEDIPF